MTARDVHGRFVKTETRSLRPPHVDEPNANVGNPPTVGPPDGGGGDPDGVVFQPGAPAPPNPPAWFHASRWDGWPDGWFPPLFSRLQQLTDVAWSALDLNASVFAAMPPYLVNAATDLPDAWLDNPDPDQYASWFDFAKQMMWDYQLGEAFILATARYGNGWPARFHVVPPWTVEPDWAPDGTRRYRIGSMDVTADMLHIRYQSTATDLHGHGPLEAGAPRMLAASVLNRYAVEFARAGGVPSSVLEHPEELTAKQSEDLRNQWLIARMENLGVPAILSGGVTWRATQVDPLQSALVELASYNESRTAVALGVPPFLLGLPTGGDSMTYSNASTLFDYHWRAGLKPRAQGLMMALSGWLIPRGSGIEVNRDEYIRPGPLERAQTQAIYIDKGVLTSEEVREMERFDTSTGSPIGLTSGVMK